MDKKNFKISASGLKNIVFNDQNGEECFTFIIGEEKLQMNKIFAEFISPRVSRIHQVDPTIDTLNISDYISKQQISQTQEIFGKEIIQKLSEISQGVSIEIDLNMS